ncbi:MAG: sigma-70 family RNA polymerase sigma factor [Magnetococcales bacterium]|nr:sigma-70 family RNA polymerase sigma factor [Magnetococcales bacterium]
MTHFSKSHHRPQGDMTSSGNDFRELFLQQWQRLETLARRRFTDPNLADEAMLHTQRAMARNDWEPLRAYEGRSQASFATYFTHVAWRMLEDFARTRLGRARVPRWITELGPFMEEVYRLLCLEGMPPAGVVSFLSGTAPGGRPEPVVWASIETVLRKATDCGRQAVMEVATEEEILEDLAGADGALHHLSPEDHKIRQQRETVLGAFHRFLTQDPETPEAAGGRLLERIREAVELTAEERLLLKLIYQDGLEVTTVGRMLGWNVNQVHGRHRRLLERIRKAMERAGLSDTLRALLAEEEKSP